MKWDEWLKKIIKEITSDYTISEETFTLENLITETNKGYNENTKLE